MKMPSAISSENTPPSAMLEGILASAAQLCKPSGAYQHHHISREAAASRGIASAAGSSSARMKDGNKRK